MPDAPSLGFAPDPARAATLDARMHRELGASLVHIAEALAEALPSESARLNELAVRLDAGLRVPALAFATYYEIARTLLADDPAPLPRLVEKLVCLPERTASQTVRAAGSPDATALVEALREPGAGAFGLAPVPPDTVASFTALLRDGLALMAETLPELHGEVTAIVHEVLLAHAPPGQKTEFDGASHYQFWGLLMLNPKHHTSPLAVVEVLAHEAAHSLLFGLTIDEPLVFNPDSELYASPLRLDPRPMDGIYHATFVSARMAWAMGRLADDRRLTEAERAAAAEAAASDRANFAKGISVVDEHARLSETGAAIMAAARDAMAIPSVAW